jgi:hypothetical protein
MPILEREYNSIFTDAPLISPKQFLDYQVETLLHLGVAKKKDANLLTQRQLPRLNYSLWYPRPIPPSEFPDLLSLIRFHDENIWLTPRSGVSCIDQRSGHVDSMAYPLEAHICFGIEDGRARTGITARENAERIAGANRRPYRTGHAIIHAISFPFFLKNHGMQILGSSCGLTGIPALRLRSGWPLLDLPFRMQGDADIIGGDNNHLAFSDLGAPSCHGWIQL